MIRVAALRAGVGFALTFIARTAPGQEPTSQIVRGRVSGPTDVPLANALVTITGATTQAQRVTRTDSNGVYAALFATGENEYTISVRSLGFAPRSVRATGNSAIVVADVRLRFAIISVSPVALDTVEVSTPAPPPLPPRNTSDIGDYHRDLGKEKQFTLDASDLVALVTRTPDALAITNAAGDTVGFSVLGSSPEHNTTIVDGSSFTGRTLPRDAIVNVRLATTTFDPGRGGFSGGQIAATTRSGGDFLDGSIRTSAAHPKLSWSDPASTSPVPSITILSASVGGPIRKPKSHYFIATELQSTTTPLTSLQNANAADLSQLGINADTLSALRIALSNLGIPATLSAIPNIRGDSRQSAFARLDFAPSASAAFALRGDANVDDRKGAGVSTLTFPSLASRDQTARAGLQLSTSIYVRGFLDELLTYIEHSRSTVQPYLDLPTGSVALTTNYSDGRTGTTVFRFGGGGTAAQSELTITRWETRHELAWLAGPTSRAFPTPPHRVKLGQALTLERTTTNQETGRFGAFGYASVSDLAANKPSSYRRSYSRRTRSTGILTTSLWAGDEWRASSSLRLQYGARLDVEHPTITPDYNPTLQSLLQARTDRLPTDIGFSPRFGFSWSKHITLSGGIGAFRGVIPPSRIASLFDATGLATTALNLECVGAATPIPNWASAATATPSNCTNGTAPAPFSTAQPNVSLLDPTFQASTSWRANLNANGIRFRGWQVTANGTYSLGFNNESAVDLNLRRAPGFTLGDEGNRPVYVSPADITTAGAIAPGASRFTNQFARVTDALSDLQNRAAQLTLTLSPPRPLFNRLNLNATYSLSTQRAQSRGFGDPFIPVWAGGQQPTQQFQLDLSARAWYLAIAARLNVTSGQAYTPLVAGDISGNGSGGDRAFIFNPSATTDSTLASEMRALLTSAPSNARACLESQLGRIAGRNSCKTGWQTRPDVHLNFVPPSNFGFGDRLHASATLINASGAVFRLLGVSNQPFARAAAISPPNPTLVFVTGFDSANKRFQYRVNQQFGEPQDFGSPGRRIYAPFQIQLELQYQFGGPPRDAMVRSLGLIAEAGRPALTVEEVRARLRSFANNPVTRVIELRDSLDLTDDQRSAVQAANAWFTAAADSILTPIAEYVVREGRRLTDANLQRRLSSLPITMRPRTDEANARVRAILTDSQRARIGPPFASTRPR